MVVTGGGNESGVAARRIRTRIGGRIRAGIKVMFGGQIERSVSDGPVCP